MSGVSNRVVLDGTVRSEPEERWTPAGLPLTRFTLEHRSRTTIADLERTVACRITVVALGEELSRAAQNLAPGQGCRVEGVLGQRVRQRPGDEARYGQLELHAQSLRPLVDAPDAQGEPPNR